MLVYFIPFIPVKSGSWCCKTTKSAAPAHCDFNRDERDEWDRSQTKAKTKFKGFNLTRFMLIYFIPFIPVKSGSWCCKTTKSAAPAHCDFNRDERDEWDRSQTTAKTKFKGFNLTRFMLVYFIPFIPFIPVKSGPWCCKTTKSAAPAHCDFNRDERDEWDRSQTTAKTKFKGFNLTRFMLIYFIPFIPFIPVKFRP
jgi:hypothetical protein